MAKVDRAVYSERQLEQVMEDFWFNHFNVFAEKGADSGCSRPTARRIRPHTMGKFRDLLPPRPKAPRCFFTSTIGRAPIPQRARAGGSRGRMRPPLRGFVRPFRPAAANPRRQQPARKKTRGLNENYGREDDGAAHLGVDAGYTQQDVIEMARCFTGWTIASRGKIRNLGSTNSFTSRAENGDGPQDSTPAG